MNLLESSSISESPSLTPAWVLADDCSDDHTEDHGPANGFEYTGQAWQVQWSFLVLLRIDGLIFCVFQQKYGTPYTQCSCSDPSGVSDPSVSLAFLILDFQPPFSLAETKTSQAVQRDVPT